MERYKEDFIEFLLKTGALKIGSDWTLKSKRLSPYFVNIGDFNDSFSTAKLGRAYAETIKNSGAGIELLYGIPEKGVALAIVTSVSIGELGLNVPWFFTRKIVKEHGEASALSKEEKIKKFVVGRAPREGQEICQLDDVFTAGDAKYQARVDLSELGDFKLPLLAIAVDRQEVGIDGKSAIEEYQAKTGTKVVSIVNTTEILQYLRTKKELDQNAVERIATYLRVYGTKQTRESLGKLEQKIINMERSIIPACDVETIGEFEELVKQTADVEKIGGYKIGFELGLGYGLSNVVEAARRHTNKTLIYDHQKAGTDIPDTGKNFARVCKKAEIDAVILFPQAGPETERAWIYHALDYDLDVIVGGRMTHPAYAQSEGGFISDEGAMEMYRIAARAGINNFVVPGNKLDVIKAVKEAVEAEGVIPTFYAPGFVAQGGKIEEAAKVAGDRWHAIVGRGIYQAKDMRVAAEEHTSQL